MNLLMRYTLTNGEVVDHQTGDFASVEAARDTCARMFDTPNAVASLQDPDGCRVINVAHVVHISIDPVTA